MRKLQILSKSYIKLQRLYSILFDKNQEPIQIEKLADSILNMVYPDLPSHLDFAFDFYKNFKLISDEENEEHISLQYRLNKILLFWPKYSYVIRNSADLITKVFFNDFEIKPEKIYLSEKVLESFQFVTSPRKKIFLQKIIQSINKQIENKDTQMPLVNNDIENELEEGILINNSGLILFWPFLKTLFVRLNLFDEATNDFKNKLSIDKAILYLGGDFWQEINIKNYWNKLVENLSLPSANLNIVDSDGLVNLLENK